jgi:rfaE bifunctional protein kinase chain/domain
MRKEKIGFISGKFSVIHEGHIRLFRLGKELSEELHVGINASGLSTEEINWRIDVLKGIKIIDKVHIYQDDNSKILLGIKPNLVIKGNEFRHKVNPELNIIEKFGGHIIFGSGIDYFSENELIENYRNEISKKTIKLPTDFLTRNKINTDFNRQFIKKVSKLKVLVLGDLIVDEFINCHPLGMSQEEPSIVVKAIDKKRFLGGAGIVAAHCTALGAETHFISVIGADENANWAESKIMEYGIKGTLFKDFTRPTTLKQRYRSGVQTLFKISDLSQEIIGEEYQAQIFELVKSCISEIDLIIFSDFSYGNLPEELVKKIIQIANMHEVIVSADSQSSSQVGNLSKFSNSSIIMPTEKEARVELKDNSSGLVVLIDALRESLGVKNVFLKLGPDGMIIRGKRSNGTIAETEKIDALNSNPVDISGAGDSILAASSLALASGFDINTSGLIGSISASIQVSRLGNIPVTAEEFESILLN